MASKILHIPVQNVGVGDQIVIVVDKLPHSFDVWNFIDADGKRTFYVRESTTWQITAHLDGSLPVIR